VISNKISVKVFAPRFDAQVLPQLIPIFHRWISQRVLEEVLIDVADYRHVFRGPGITLVGLDSNYYLDESDGGQGSPQSGWGLVCFRKRALASPQHPLLDALRRVLTACDKLEREFGSAGGVFDAGTLEIRIADRVAVTPDFREHDWTDYVGSQLAPLYGGTSLVELSHHDGLPAMRVRHPDPYVASSVLERLTGRRVLLS
jgi:hypothetical protein